MVPMKDLFISCFFLKNSTLGAGANILAKELSFNPNLPIRNMTVENYNEVSILFENWPFKPEHLDSPRW
jgi:hypothetical protein